MKTVLEYNNRQNKIYINGQEWDLYLSNVLKIKAGWVANIRWIYTTISFDLYEFCFNRNCKMKKKTFENIMVDEFVQEISLKDGDKNFYFFKYWNNFFHAPFESDPNCKSSAYSSSSIYIKARRIYCDNSFCLNVVSLK